MPLPADRTRVELGLRLLALGSLAWLVVEAFTDRRPRGTAHVTEPVTESQLARWLVDPPAENLAVSFGTTPSPVVREGLRALRRSGTAIAWADDGVPATMAEAEARPDPGGGLVLRVTGPAAGSLAIEDDLGLMDSVGLGALGATVRLPEASGTLRLRSGGSVASIGATLGPSRRLALVGIAGWEAKFILAALEERGWEVDARLAVAPGRSVVQGQPFPLDTARQAAVIVLDSSATDVAVAIARFVASGGGAVIGPGAGGLAGLRAIVPGRGRAMVRPLTASFGATSPRAALEFRDLAPLTGDAVPVESREGRIAIAIRRAGAGRVVQVGYLDTWRWRMSGGAGSVAAHRAWWSDLVAMIAYQPGSPVTSVQDPAPRASLIEALGEPSPMPLTASGPDLRLTVALILLLIGMCGEWASRRLRGAP